MLALQIIALLVAWASATFGTWSKDNVDRRRAFIATGITSLGLIVGITLSLYSFIAERDAAARARTEAELQEQRAEMLLSQLQLSLTGTELTHLRIEWVFNDAPKSISDLFLIGTAMDDATFYNDDLLSRLADTTKERISEAFHIRNVIAPLLAVLGRGGGEMGALFKGPVDEVLGSSDDPEAALDVEYVGPEWDLVFPLNWPRTTALALGRLADDTIAPVQRQGFDGYVDKLLNFGFQADAQLTNGELRLEWEYGADSLRRAACGKGKPVAIFPAEFDIVAIQNRPEGCLEALRDGHLDREITATHLNTWGDQSELTITANAINESARTYTVERVGRFERVIEYSKYDDPQVEFEYTVFRARVKQQPLNATP